MSDKDKKPAEENGLEIRYAKGKKRRKVPGIRLKKVTVLGEFKKFALRGNVIDLAVGVIIGGAFQKIVSSVVSDLAMPLIGMVTGDVNFDDQFLVLRAPDNADLSKIASLADAKAAGLTTLNYGAFITAVINFLIMAIVIFCMVKLINRLSDINKKPEEAPAAPAQKTCPYCLSGIPAGAYKCRHCGSDQPEMDAT